MMYFKAFQEASMFSKILLLLFFMVVCCCLFVFAAAIICFFMVGGNMEAFQQSFSTNASLPVLRILQASQSIGLFLIPPFIVASLIEKEGIPFLKLKSVYLYPALISILLVILFFPLINWLGSINQKMHLPDFLLGIEQWMRDKENQAAELTQKFLFAQNYIDVLINLFVMALLPALGEELLFRGIIQQYVQRISKNAHAAVWITAILFSAIHIQFFGFFPRMILGAVLGYLFVFSGNLWYSILLHFFNNGLAVILYFFYQKGQLTTNPETIASQPSDIWFVLLSTALALGLIIKFRNLFLSVHNK